MECDKTTEEIDNEVNRIKKGNDSEDRFRLNNKTIMIVDEEPNFVPIMQTYAFEECIDIIHVRNSRQGVIALNDNPSVKLVLVSTKNPETNIQGYVSINPSANLINKINEQTEVLQKPFSKEQFRAFIEQKL